MSPEPDNVLDLPPRPRVPPQPAVMDADEPEPHDHASEIDADTAAPRKMPLRTRIMFGSLATFGIFVAGVALYPIVVKQTQAPAYAPPPVYATPHPQLDPRLAPQQVPDNELIDQLRSRTEALEHKIAALASHVEANENAAPDLALLRSRLDDYDQWKSQIEQRFGRLETVSTPKPSHKPAPPKSEQPRPAPGVAPDATTKRPPKASTPAAVATPIFWQLRAISGDQSGAVLVDRHDPAAAKLVHIGDQLPGLGQILAIGDFNGAPVVIGSAGRATAD
jgi:hypothetical protein